MDYSTCQSYTYDAITSSKVLLQGTQAFNTMRLLEDMLRVRSQPLLTAAGRLPGPLEGFLCGKLVF